ncbi:MAG: BamA/TamA family outer membrane protein, partial [Deinococcus sp.]|nr:BamA/TamA family outer membrane protein [Deinococcus sp.]
LGRIALLYLQRGFALAGQLPGQGGRPQIEGAARSGVLTITVAEVRIEEVQFTFINPNPVTQPITVNRQLAIHPGDPFSVNGVVATLRNLSGTNLFGSIDPNEDVAIRPGSAPDLAVIEIQLSERPVFVPGLTVGTRNQAGQVSVFGQASLSLTNLFGLGHAASVSVGVGPQGNLDLEASYSIPFLNLFGDDQTSLHLRIFDTSSEGVSLMGVGDGSTFTLVNQGLSLGLSRPLTPNLDLGVRLESAFEFALPDPLFPAPPVEDDIVPLLPGLVTQIGAGLTLDTRDSSGFPTAGLTASADLDLGFGDDIFDDGLTNPVNFLRPVASSAQFFAIDPQRNWVLALRQTIGLVSGVAPLDELLRVGGNSPGRTVLIQRGLNAESFMGSFAAGATFEVRFRIPLEPVATLVPVVFADYTTITTEDQPGSINTLGYGVGLQINLEVPGLPPIPVRLDYGFSDVNPSGVLLFSVNPLF